MRDIPEGDSRGSAPGCRRSGLSLPPSPNTSADEVETDNLNRVTSANLSSGL